KAFKTALHNENKPFAIIAKTKKGKGLTLLEDQLNWHGKALKKEELDIAIKELDDLDITLTGKLSTPAIPTEVEESLSLSENPTYVGDASATLSMTEYKKGELIATRKAYGNALANIGKVNSDIIVLDAETKNSTFSETFEKAFPDRFFEMFIAEQNMVGVATGLSRRNKIPFISTFTAFFTRAFDQIRMSQYSEANIKYVGSHAGVSIGEDGSSQMGLEDLSMFSSLLNSVVLYPSDAVSTEKLVATSAEHQGVVYIRTTRMETPVLYDVEEDFPIGGSKTLKSSDKDIVTLIAAGVTLHESLKAYDQLKAENIFVRVIDLYSIKPIDYLTLEKAINETNAIITVEDHYPHGGIGSAVSQALSSIRNAKPIYMLAVTKLPKSGKPEELLEFEEISANAIVKKVKEVVMNHVSKKD
ncbi:MAG TPA: transketolase, partial [Candidatus Nitrosocosmicus sp.]|nr:transketolase [Candidatus Nitrosocosmicus sp.]